jgi:hypothetical protein
MVTPDGKKLSANEQELREWPENIRNVIADETHRRAAQQSASAQKAKRRRIVLIFCLCAVVLLISSFFIWRRLSRQHEPLQVSANPKNPDLQSSKFDPKSTDIWEYYKRTEASVKTDEGEEILKVVQYDFYGGKFIVDNTHLRNEDILTATFAGMRDELKDGWVLIFATASLEGRESHNLILCCRRLYAIKQLMVTNAGESNKGYWGILAGEANPKELNGVAPEERHEVKNKLAREHDKEWLAEQRKLIVVSIRQTQPLSAESEVKVPFVVAKYLYDHNLLPHDYQGSNSTPKQLSESNCGSDTR